MKPSIRVIVFCAAVSWVAQAVAGEPVVRVKAKLTGFDGHVMSLEPLASAKGQEPLSVAITPQTRFVAADQAVLTAIEPGEYAGAATVEDRDGRLRAQEVFLYPEALRGSGEGRFPEGDRLMINGTVKALAAPGAAGARDSLMTLHYRGAVLTGRGGGRTVCEGRASPPAFASALACESDAAIAIGPATPISALKVGDKSLLVPGSLVTVAMTRSDDDKNVGLGVVVEKAATVEKPQSRP